MNQSYILLFCLVLIINFIDASLVWSDNYHLKAILTVPDANIVEPYEVWANSKSSSLRVDYYNGVDKLYKVYEGGSLSYLKMHPETTEKIVNKQVCHKIPGNTGTMKLQLKNAYLPVKRFQFIGKEKLNKVKAEKWIYSFVALPEFNTTIVMTLWITRLGNSPVPLRYEYQMKVAGHSLDYFRHDYLHYDPSFSDNKVFEIPNDLKCEVITEMTDYEAVDPLLEYIDPQYEYLRVSSLFDSFKLKHNKVYNNEMEHMKRMHIFKNNLRYINSVNRQHRLFSLAVNHLADLTDDELSVFLGTRNAQNDKYKNNNDQILGGDEDVEDNSDDFEDEIDDDTDPADCSFDWRDYNAITPVKDQTPLCGSCYAFSTAAVIESTAYIARGCNGLDEVSEQALVDCTWSSQAYLGNYGCMGGTYEYTMKWVKHNGVPFKKEYGPYLAMEGLCHMKNMSMLVKIRGSNELKRKVALIKAELRKHGPLLAAINISPKSFLFYSKGIYDDSRCRSEPEERNHGLIIVGYGRHLDQKYWILKNSYGVAWGEGGYMRINMQNNICGVKNYVRSVKFINNKIQKCFSKKRNNQYN